MPKSIYTDLAMEARELSPEISGITEESGEDGGISISRISVTSNDAAEQLGKPVGRYITLDAPDLVNRPLDLYERLSRRIAEELKLLLGDVPEEATVLVIGLGNRFITPDALGPRVAEQVYVTRHITEYLPEITQSALRPVCAVSPGVLGVTGVETLEVVKGVVERIKPAAVIVIDALASRRAARISTTVQMCDTGISPGAGVGNKRSGLDAESLGAPVIAIGVPTVVYATTISQDTISLIADETGLHNDEEKLLGLVEKVINEKMGPMIVTPKDIDSIVTDMSRVLADGINLALHDMNYNEVRSLIA